MTNPTFFLAAIAATSAFAVAQDPCMMRAIGWRTDAVFTIGNFTVDENGAPFQPTGILDGMGAFQNPTGPGVAVYVNNEHVRGVARPYALTNGTMMTGARITKFVVSRNADGSGQVESAEVAIKAVFDRRGDEVVDPAQINVGTGGINGLGRFCSGNGIQGGTFSFVEDVYLCGEEDGTNEGGTVYVLDIDTGNLWAAPGLGRGAWENIVPIETGDPQTVALMAADDTNGAPMWLYIGVKNSIGNGSFLDRNGLAVGQLYYFKADDANITTAEQFNTTGSSTTGTWVPIEIRDISMAGTPGFDVDGFKIDSRLRSDAAAGGAFRFSRPEDLHPNPDDGTQVVFASTGSSFANGNDIWGTIYVFDNDLSKTPFTCTLTIAWDSDNVTTGTPDDFVRSPDNLTWADNGMVYIQEDRSTGLFGQMSGREASIWELDPTARTVNRIGEMNRTVVLPLDATDGDPTDLGDWESSGVIDVTDFFDTAPGETLLFANVQAHSVRDGSIGDNANLDEGGQLFFMSSRGIDQAVQGTLTAPVRTGEFFITNGTPNNGYAVVLGILNAGSAPNGFFFGVDVTFIELGNFLFSPLIGTLDADGAANFSIPGIPAGLAFDTVVVEVDIATGLPVDAGPAVTVNF